MHVQGRLVGCELSHGDPRTRLHGLVQVVITGVCNDGDYFVVARELAAPNLEVRADWIVSVGAFWPRAMVEA
jgi:hypothetical protein